MADDKEVKVKLTLEDEYSDKVEQAAEKTEKLDQATQDLKGSTLEENVAFLTTIETLDKFGGSVSKIRGGLEDTGLVSEDTAKQLMKVQGAVDLLVGSAEIFMMVQRVMNAEMLKNITITRTQALAMGTLAASAGAVGFAYAAINAGSREQAALYSTLTGITAGLAAAEFTLAVAKFSEAVAGWGPAAPIIAGIIMAAIAGGATYLASLKASAQTEEGEVRTVEQTGLVLVHAGEQIGRVSEPQQAATGSIQVVVNGHIKPVDERTLADHIAKAIKWGV